MLCFESGIFFNQFVDNSLTSQTTISGGIILHLITPLSPTIHAKVLLGCANSLEEHMKSLLLENLPYRNTQKINE
ncbi:hypothetical protein CK203_035577 [Vitis vinifera]|uniref:Uncharacterized protein n=1 Tax=Vitis vinifera TaxID=29760 RepID=A0A438HPL4_VITVI|nr:hypothetical protein CK203_035577 [Vitis vinifera]